MKGMRNLNEGRHDLGGHLFHGRKGELHRAYRDGQENQLGALGLVWNCVTLWTTAYLDPALTDLRGQGYPVLRCGIPTSLTPTCRTDQPGRGCSPLTATGPGSPTPGRFCLLTMPRGWVRAPVSRCPRRSARLRRGVSPAQAGRGAEDRRGGGYGRRYDTRDHQPGRANP
jgi:hypothetical protein